MSGAKTYKADRNGPRRRGHKHPPDKRSSPGSAETAGSRLRAVGIERVSLEPSGWLPGGNMRGKPETENGAFGSKLRLVQGILSTVFSPTSCSECSKLASLDLR